MTAWVVASAIGGGLLSVALIVVGSMRRRRLRDEIRSADPVIDDRDIERILASGTLVKDDEPPLDLDAIADEEERFWDSESWDPAEEL